MYLHTRIFEKNTLLASTDQLIRILEPQLVSTYDVYPSSMMLDGFVRATVKVVVQNICGECDNSGAKAREKAPKHGAV